MLDFKKLPIIRHLRCLYLAICFDLYWTQISERYLHPNKQDIEYLKKVWRGEI